MVHLLFRWGLDYIPVPPPPQPVMEFQVLENQKSKDLEKQIVRNSVIPEKLKTDQTNDPLRFLAEKVQRVKEQLKAKQSGLTQNRSETIEGKKNLKTYPQKPKISDFAPDQIRLPSLSPDHQPNNQEKGISTLSDDISDDVKVGSITALNTDQYLYYSFFSRSGELLYNEWAPRVQNVLENPPSQLKSSIHDRFTSVIEVWFKPNGEFHSAHLLKYSGIDLFDQIALDSFKKVKMFPNPPKERIEKDGLIRFKWQLSVHYNPKVLVRQY